MNKSRKKTQKLECAVELAAEVRLGRLSRETFSIFLANRQPNNGFRKNVFSNEKVVAEKKQDGGSE